MYFDSRVEAGRKLIPKLQQYTSQNVVVVALGDGAVVVGEPVAVALGSPLMLLVSEEIRLPGEQTALGSVTQDGSFTYSSELSDGEIDEYYSEFHGFIDDQKREKFAKINHRLLGEGGLLNAEMLRHRIVILLSDGLKSSLPLDGAQKFLKPIKISRLVVATPIASVQAVDRMHIIADELHCLSVTDNYIDTNHYYNTNDLPDHEAILAKVKNPASESPKPLL